MREVTPSDGTLALIRTDAPWRGQAWKCHVCGTWWVLEGWHDVDGDLEFEDRYPFRAKVEVKAFATCKRPECWATGTVSARVPNPWYDPKHLADQKQWTEQMDGKRDQLPTVQDLSAAWDGVDMSIPLGH